MPVAAAGQAGRRVDEEVDEAAQQADDLLGLAARRGPQVDAVEVEGPERGERTGRGFGHPDPAGAVDRVEHRVHERADLAGPLRPTTPATASGRSAGVRMPGAHRVLEVVAHVGDAVGPGDDLALGRGRRGPAPRMVAHAVERLRAQVERAPA